MAPICITIRSLSGESTEIEIEASASIADLKVKIQAAAKIPIVEQRLVFAGTQLEEVASEAWRRRRQGTNGSVLSAALQVESIPDGAPLTLEHYSIQKGSVVNIVRRIASNTPVEADAPGSQTPVAPAPNPAPVQAPPVLEFMEPEPRNPGRAPLPPGNGGSGGYSGYGAQSSNGRDRAAQELTSRLESLDDVALYALLGPLLQKRPQLRTSLLQAPAAEERRPSVDRGATSSGAVDVVRASFNQARAARAGTPSEQREYRKGDLVYVFSNSAQRWCEGTVLQVSTQATGKIPQGSVEVSFELGQKWIAPQDAAKTLKAR